MVNLNQKITQFFLGTLIGVCLAIFFPIDLAWGKNDEVVLDSILATTPVLVAIAVSLAAVTASITFFLGIIKLNNNMDEGLPAIESSLLFSGGEY